MVPIYPATFFALNPRVQARCLQDGGGGGREGGSGSAACGRELGSGSGSRWRMIGESSACPIQNFFTCGSGVNQHQA